MTTTDPGCCGIRRVDEDGCCVACGRDFFDPDTGEERGDGSRVANARFIAAAPDMEAALDGLLRMCFEDLSGEESGAIIEVALAALAKARGK